VPCPRFRGKIRGEDQIIRALRELVREGRLIRLGYGVYARAGSTQVPMNAVVRVKGRFARRLGYGSNSFVVERRTYPMIRQRFVRPGVL
jgi:hypothetical protein